MSNFSMSDFTKCPRCGRAAELRIESGTCHDWNEVLCHFCGYFEDIDLNDPEDPTSTIESGVGALCFYADNAGTSILIQNLEELKAHATRFRLSQPDEYQWFRLTKWNESTQSVEIVIEFNRDYEIPEHLQMDYRLPEGHRPWWVKELEELEQQRA